MATIETIIGEGAFDGTVRRQINTNFATVGILHQSTPLTLNNAAIKGLPTQANWPTLVAAPGANKVLILDSAVVYTSLESAYASFSTNFPTSIVTISYDDDFQIASTPQDPQTLFHDTGGRVGLFLPQQILSPGSTVSAMFTDIGNIANLPLKLVVYNSAGNLTSGNALNTMTLSVAYYIYNVSTNLFE
jgi:hypothetical protein